VAVLRFFEFALKYQNLFERVLKTLDLRQVTVDFKITVIESFTDIQNFNFILLNINFISKVYMDGLPFNV